MKFFIWPINSGVLTSLLLPHLSSTLTDSLPSLNLLCHSKADARFMQDAPKAVWSIPYVSVAFFPSFKQNFIVYRSFKVSSRPDCIFEIHQLWQWGFSRVYSNCCCSCSFEPEIIRIGQSSHSNKILNFQESTTILNACTKKVWKLIEGTSYVPYIAECEARRYQVPFLKSLVWRNLGLNSETLFKFIHSGINVYSKIWHFLNDLRSVCLSYLPNPSARAGYDTRSIFKRSLTGFNSEFFFS